MTNTEKSVFGILSITVVLPVIMLTACSVPEQNSVVKPSTDITESYQLPVDLKDCKVFRLAPKDSNAPWLYVVKCNSNTDTQWHHGTRTMKVSST